MSGPEAWKHLQASLLNLSSRNSSDLTALLPFNFKLT